MPPRKQTLAGPVPVEAFVSAANDAHRGAATLVPP